MLTKEQKIELVTDLTNHIGIFMKDRSISEVDGVKILKDVTVVLETMILAKLLFKEENNDALRCKN